MAVEVVVTVSRMRELFRWATAPVLGTARRVRRHLPTDLVVVCGFVLLATWVLVVWNPTSPVVRAVVGVPLLFLLPGYALVALLYPRSPPADVTPSVSTNDPVERVRGVTGVERIALSFGASFAVLPMIGLTISTVTAFTTTTVVTAVGGFVVVVTLLAAGRRLRLPLHERYRIDIGAGVTAIREGLYGRSSVHAAVNVALVVSTLLALTTGGYALLAPQDGEQYTTMQLLSEDDSGDLVAANYPEEIGPRGVVPLVVAVDNQEGETMEYTAVAQQQRLEDGEVVEREEIDRFDYRLEDGATGHADRTLEPTAEDGEIRIALLLYPGDTPETPTTENAYRYTHVWTEVQPADE